MLRRVLERVEASDGAVDLRALSRALGVEQSALEGMIQHWVRKRRLADSGAGVGLMVDSRGEDGTAAGACASCRRSCSGATACPFLLRAPRTIAFVPEDPA